MPEIKLKARIQNKYNTLEEWNKLNKGEFIPLKGEACYTIDNNMLYQKIGDGQTDFTDLAWLVNQADWNESNENAPSYVKNKIGYKKFNTEKSELYKYTFSNQGEEYPKFQLEAIEGLGTVGMTEDYFDNTAKTDFTFYINNQTLPYLELTDLTITKNVTINNESYYYTGNIYPLAMTLFEHTEEDLIALGIEKTEDSYGFIYMKTEQDFFCYIWVPEIYTSYYQLVISGYNFQIVPIPEEFLDINYDQFVGRYDKSNTYGEIFNDYVNNKASGSYSHVEGNSNSALGNGSHAEGQGGESTHTVNNVIRSSNTSFIVSGNKLDLYKREIKCPIHISTNGIDHTNTLTDVNYDNTSNQTTFTVSSPLPESLPSTFQLGVLTGVAQGIASHVEGGQNNSIGNYSHTEGQNNKSKGRASHTEGYYNSTEGNYSHAEGYYNSTTSDYSHAEGSNNEVTGLASHAEGENNKATGKASHVEGSNNIASGDYSHSEGRNSEASGQYSHSEGRYTTAIFASSHAEGDHRLAEGNGAHAEGYGDYNIGRLTVTFTSSNTFTHTFDDPKKFFEEDWSSALYVIDNNSRIQISNVKLDNNKVATFTTRTTMPYAVGTSKGFRFVGIGRAEGNGAHIEGQGTTVSGHGAHAEGIGTIGNGNGTHVQGRYNAFNVIPGELTYSTDLSNYAHIVGNGTIDARSNAHTLDWNGNAWYAGTVQATDFLDAEGNSFMDKVNNHINEVIGGIENGSY